MYINDHMIS